MSTPDRWLRFETAEGPRHGYVAGDSIVPIAGDLFGEWRRAGDPVSLAGAKLLAPVIPPTFYACGINYEGHWRTAAEEFGLDLDKTWPRSPEIGYRAQGAIVGPGDAIVLPRDVPPNVQVEAELAVVIGKRAKRVSAADALDCVFGYTICNDVSARGWQFQDRTFWRSKNSDTFKPMGPVVVDGIDPMNQRITVRVNGKEASSYNTSGAIFSLQHYIARMSAYVTLWPGDIIWLGCDGPTLPALEPGDLVEVVNDAIGVLANRVVRSSG